MRSTSSKPTSRRARILLAGLAAVLAIALGAPQQALATTSAGAKITNSVSVSFDDPGGNPQPPAGDTIEVTVNQVYAAPLLENVTQQVGGVDVTETSEGETVVQTYGIWGQGNGVDTYNLVDTVADTNVGNETLKTLSTPNVTLGATGLAQALVGGEGSFTVAYDGTNDGIANGIAAGDLIRIGANIYKVAVAGIAENAPAGFTTITLDAGYTIPTIIGAAAEGDPIGEYATFTVQFDTGTIVPAQSQGQHDTTIDATSQGDGTQTTNLTGYTILVKKPTLAVNKYVRNVLNASGNPVAPADYTIGLDDYWAAGVTGDPGDTLEYVVVISNGGAADAENVVMEDTFSPFTTLVAGQVEVDQDGDGTYDVTGNVALDGAGDIVETDSGDIAGATKLKAYAGSGGDETAAGGYGGSGGAIAGSGGKSVVKYQLTIN